jgi:hypothetical protein
VLDSPHIVSGGRVISGAGRHGEHKAGVVEATGRLGKDHDAAERWFSLALVEIARLTAQRRLNLALAAVEQVLKLVRSELDDLRADHKLIRCELEEILLSARRLTNATSGSRRNVERLQQVGHDNAAR